MAELRVPPFNKEDIEEIAKETIGAEFDLESNASSVTFKKAVVLEKGISGNAEVSGQLSTGGSLYIHPININKGEDNAKGGRYTLFIFNNSATPIDTIAKLQTAIDNIYAQAGETIRILVNGGGYSSDDNQAFITNFIGKSSTGFYLSVVLTDGTSKVFSNSSLDTLLGSPEQINDGVNKLL